MVDILIIVCLWLMYFYSWEYLSFHKLFIRKFVVLNLLFVISICNRKVLRLPIEYPFFTKTTFPSSLHNLFNYSDLSKKVSVIYLNSFFFSISDNYHPCSCFNFTHFQRWDFFNFAVFFLDWIDFYFRIYLYYNITALFFLRL